MVVAKPKVEIKLELLESKVDCGTGACGCGCGSADAELEKAIPVVAGGSGDGCCEPGCSPETCGSS
jgi:hypothetical protein